MIETTNLDKMLPKTEIPRVPSPVTTQQRNSTSSFEEHDQVDSANYSSNEMEDTVDEMKEDSPEQLLTTSSGRSNEQKEDVEPDARDEVACAEEEIVIQDKPLLPNSYSSKGEKKTLRRTMLPPIRATSKEVESKSSPTALDANNDTPSAVRIAQGPVTWNKDRLLIRKETKGNEVISRPPRSLYSGDRESAFNASPSISSKRWEGGVSKIDAGLPTPMHSDDEESAHSKSSSLTSKRWEGGMKKTVWKSALFQRMRSSESTNVKSVDRGGYGADEDMVRTKIERSAKNHRRHSRSRSMTRETTR